MSTPRWTRYYNANKKKAIAASMAWQAANPEKVRTIQATYRAIHRDRIRGADRERNATTRHGITRIIRDWMYESQNRSCAGCLTPMADADLEIDHDHACCPGDRSCGRCVRGLVCHPCNSRDVMTAVFAIYDTQEEAKT